MKLRGVSCEFAGAHCSWVFMCVFMCFSFFSAATYLVYAVGFHAQKEKSKYFFVRFARVFGYKMAAPRRANPTKKTSLDTCLIWLVVFFVSCAAIWLQTCALVTRWKSLSSWSAWTRWLHLFF